MFRRRCTFLLSAALLAVASTAFGQFGSFPGAVTGSGTAKIERPPEVMRMQISLLARGKDIKEALANFKKRKAAAATQVADLGAAKETIKIDSPNVDQGSRQQQRQMEMMIRQRLGRGQAPKKQTNPPITLSATLTAEWPLKGKPVEDLLVTVHELQKKIKDADVAGAKESSPLSLEQQELLEEMGGFDGGYGDQPDPSQPFFMFVSTVSEDERAKLLAEAYASAKSEAEKLAAATGGKLGELRFVNGQNSGIGYNDEYNYRYDNYAYQAYRQMQGNQRGAESNEAVGMVPGNVTFQVMVNASFDLAK